MLIQIYYIQQHMFIWKTNAMKAILGKLWYKKPDMFAIFHCPSLTIAILSF